MRPKVSFVIRASDLPLNPFSLQHWHCSRAETQIYTLKHCGSRLGVKSKERVFSLVKITWASWPSPSGAVHGSSLGYSRLGYSEGRDLRLERGSKQHLTEGTNKHKGPGICLRRTRYTSRRKTRRGITSRIRHRASTTCKSKCLQNSPNLLLCL